MTRPVQHSCQIRKAGRRASLPPAAPEASAPEPWTTSPLAFCVSPSTKSCDATEHPLGETNCGKKANLNRSDLELVALLISPSRCCGRPNMAPAWISPAGAYRRWAPAGLLGQRALAASRRYLLKRGHCRCPLAGLGDCFPSTQSERCAIDQLASAHGSPLFTSHALWVTSTIL